MTVLQRWSQQAFGSGEWGVKGRGGGCGLLDWRGPRGQVLEGKPFFVGMGDLGETDAGDVYRRNDIIEFVRFAVDCRDIRWLRSAVQLR